MSNVRSPYAANVYTQSSHPFRDLVIDLLISGLLGDCARGIISFARSEEAEEFSYDWPARE
jgi:hypothetical protein